MANSADKKPELYTGPDGKRKVRMVPTDKDIDKQQQDQREACATRSRKMAAEELTKALEMMKKSLVKQAEAAKPFEMEESATSMRNMKLMTKIKKSGAVKDGSMAKKTLEPKKKEKSMDESAYLKGSIESRADAHEDQADHHNAEAEKFHKAGDKMAASVHKAAARAHMKAASYFDKHLSKPAHLRPQAAGGATSQAAHAATQKANQYNESVDLDEVLDTPDKMINYKNRAKYSRDKASNSQAAHALRGTDPSKDKDTERKRNRGLATLDKVAAKKMRKALTKEATIPQGKTAFTSKTPAKIKDSDKEKLLKIRLMLDKEKKPTNEEKDPRLARAGVSGFNKAKRTPNHPTKSHIVVAKDGDKVKTIRFGQQGVKTAGAPKKGESDRQKARRRSFKARHGADIAKGKMSAAYWADKEKW